jgi:hypothetical protein
MPSAAKDLDALSAAACAFSWIGKTVAYIRGPKVWEPAGAAASQMMPKPEPLDFTTNPMRRCNLPLRWRKCRQPL